MNESDNECNPIMSKHFDQWNNKIENVIMYLCVHFSGCRIYVSQDISFVIIMIIDAP